MDGTDLSQPYPENRVKHTAAQWRRRLACELPVAHASRLCSSDQTATGGTFAETDSQAGRLRHE